MRVSALPVVIPTWRYAAAVNGTTGSRQPEIPAMIDYTGHGVVERATESTSVAHVMAHERAHLAQYQTLARAKGLEVVAEDIDIRLEMRNGVPVAVAGQATATLRPPQAEGSPPGETTAADEAGTAPKAGAAADGTAPSADQQLAALPAPDERELESAAQAARTQLAAAEAELQQIAAAPAADDVRAESRAESAAAEAEAELHDLENARQTLLLSRMLEQISTVVSDAAQQSLGVAARIAYAAVKPGAPPQPSRLSVLT